MKVATQGDEVLLDGRPLTVAQALRLSEDLRDAVAEIRRRQDRLLEEQRRSETWPAGLDYVHPWSDGVKLARRDGLPVVVRYNRILHRWEESQAPSRGHVGDGPPVECRVAGGRRWHRPDSRSIHGGQRIAEWRLAAESEVEL